MSTASSNRSPLMTRLLYRAASRHSSLNDTDRASLNTILANDQYTGFASDVLDDTAVSIYGATYGKFGDGTLLQILIQNLPQIIAAILALINAMHPTPSPTPTPTPTPPKPSSISMSSSEFPQGIKMPFNADTAIPPWVIQIAEQAAAAAFASLWPKIEVAVQNAIDKYLGHNKA